MRNLVLAPFAAALAACTPAGTFEGKVAGHALTVRDAIAAPYFTMGTTTYTGPKPVGLFLSNKTGLCEQLKAASRAKYATGLGAILTHTVAGKDQAVVAGTYAVAGAAQSAVAAFTLTDGACDNTLASDEAFARSGSIKLDTVDARPGGRVSGSFDLVFGAQGDRGKGTFVAAWCDTDAGVELTDCL